MKQMETAFFFECKNDSLLGVIAAPDEPRDTGVVIVVGGPQYRVGSHRQFTLLARRLARAGVSTLRFDYRGMGDSTGEPRGYEDIAADIRCAIDAFVTKVPGLQRVVLWGLCDGASAACFYAPTDPRVKGLVLANPWIRTEQTEAQAYLKQYYVRRVFDRDFWRKLSRGAFRIGPALRSLAGNVKAASIGRAQQHSGNAATSLPSRVIGAIGAIHGRVLVLLSANDLVAAEFKGLMQTMPWKAMTTHAAVESVNVDDANHTFSTAPWRDLAADATAAWMDRHFSRQGPLSVPLAGFDHAAPAHVR